MTFQMLQHGLRKKLWEKIESRGLTGTALASRAGLQQAHISNFLNGKRGLSLEAMDRVLAAENLSVLDLIDPEEINRRASIPTSEEAEFQNVPLVRTCRAAGEPRIARRTVWEILKFRSSFLNNLRASCDEARAQWERFVALRVDAREGMSMFPRLLPGATVLIDRHYNSLEPYRRSEHNMYVVRSPEHCSIRYIESVGGNIVLRPHNPAYPVEMLAVGAQLSASDYVVGRVAQIGIET
ncbi:MAG TPA: LexA family transcriptional regulator [Terriglobales bacterium]|nr:LexA family transcriptional regulator [Terriglobales bacterium]